jgi:aerobic carbon-monoxide dehydrogenase medium subunit
MKPAPFAYFAPDTLEETLALREQHAGDTAVLAGGQSLLPILNLRLAQPGVVIDINRVPELDGIRERDGGLSLGARVRQRAAERSQLVRERAPLVAHALPFIAHPAIRSRGTLGGSLAHGDPAAELPAAVLALDAELVIRSAARGERIVAAADFFRTFLSTAVEADELLVELRLPAPLDGAGVAFLEVARSHGSFALVGVAAIVQVDRGLVSEARLVFLGASGTPIRPREVEAALVGAEPSAEAFASAAHAALDELDPVSDVHATAAYRRHVAAVLARRALGAAAAAALDGRTGANRDA